MVCTLKTPAEFSDCQTVTASSDIPPVSSPAYFQKRGMPFFSGVITVSITIARYYTPELGRWTSRDPIGERGGRNLFRFCRNNPIVYFDQYGLLFNEGDVLGRGGSVDNFLTWLTGADKVADEINNVINENDPSTPPAPEDTNGSRYADLTDAILTGDYHATDEMTGEAYDYLAGLYDRLRKRRIELHNAGGLVTKERHCIMSCEITKELSRFYARSGGLVNELQGLIIDIRNINLRIENNSDWAFQFSDFVENEAGIWCATNKPDCSCEECCTCNE